MLFLMLSNNEGADGFPPIPSSSELPWEGQLHRGTPMEWVSVFFAFLCVLCNEVFYDGRSANPATKLQEKGNPTTGGCLQTQMGNRYGCLLPHKELLGPLRKQ